MICKQFSRLLSALLMVLAATPSLAADLTLEQAVQGSNRSPEFVARDTARHPVEELRFFGVTPQSNVVEIWPGGGYWTEILAPYLRDRGTYHVAFDLPNGKPEDHSFALGPSLAARLIKDPEDYGRIDYNYFGMQQTHLLTPNSVDIVLAIRNLHNWVRDNDAAELLAGVHRVLKPGGILAIEDHRGKPQIPQDPGKYGYLHQDFAIALVEKAGFKLVGTSEINANPRDTADYPRGVWTLPPTFVLGDQDRAKYAAIGEADNFVLKFQKVD